MLDGMMGAALRSFGVDPDLIMGQAKQLGETFAKLMELQSALAEQVAEIQRGQQLLLVHFGLAPVALTPDSLRLIATGLDQAGIVPIGQA